MEITNFKNLAKNSLRRKALLIAKTGHEAIDIEKVVQQKIKIKQNQLFIFNPAVRSNTITRDSIIKLDLNKYKRVFLVGIGKGSILASLSLAKILGDKLTSGIALDIQYQDIRCPKIKRQYLGHPMSPKLKFLIGTHPLPSKQNIAATKKIIELVKKAGKDDLIVAFICGGGSALLCGSEKELKNSVLATKLLTQAGANILELNTVRKHLSLVKAGGLAKLAYPANIISLIVSDVLGNNLSMVASGPTVFDKTTKKEAEKVLKKYFNMGTSDVPNINRNNFRTSDVQKLKFVETPKNKKYFKKIKNILFLSNREPVLAMAEKAKKLGFKSKIYSHSLQGEAKDSLLLLIKKVLGLSLRAKRSNLINRKGAVILAGGETTVTLQSSKFKVKSLNFGKGGRNMEAVLGALTTNYKRLTTDTIFMSFASDGRDNTEAAGAIGDILTIKKAQKLKLNSQKYLDRHDSFNFFKKTKDLIFTEQKTFNVADLMIVLKSTNSE
ncbi:MAG: DUF4147 domain-containing protein [bacterium]|nr:DUF4147 domain-containing protein [bacterium]